MEQHGAQHAAGDLGRRRRQVDERAGHHDLQHGRQRHVAVAPQHAMPLDAPDEKARDDRKQRCGEPPRVRLECGVEDPARAEPDDRPYQYADTDEGGQRPEQAPP